MTSETVGFFSEKNISMVWGKNDVKILLSKTHKENSPWGQDSMVSEGVLGVLCMKILLFHTLQV